MRTAAYNVDVASDRHSDEMRSILELLDKEKSDKLCQIYATKKHPTARNL